MYASATADARLNEGQLNINAEVGGAEISGEINSAPIGKTTFGAEGSINAMSATAFAGLKDSSVGVEAGAALLTFTGAGNIKVSGTKIRGHAQLYVGGATAGFSIGAKTEIKIGLGLGIGLGVDISKEDSTK